MPSNLRKFVSPKFTLTINPDLMARLFERHRHRLGTFDLEALRGDADAARNALEAFFAGPEEHCPEGLVADLHRVAELGTAQGLRLLLAQAARLKVVIAPESHADDADRRLDPKHVALRVFLDHPKVFDAASDMLALTVRSSLAEFAGLHEGVEADMSDAARAAFEAAPEKMFEADHCGRYCRVGWYDDADTVNLVVTHGSIVRTAAILRGAEERLVSYRAAENAVLSYSAATGRIKIGGGTRLRRSALSELFADKMLGRSGFFAGPDAQNLYTLAPIERTGCGFVFQHGFDPAIRKVRIVEAQADRVSVDRFSGIERLAATFVARDDRGFALNQLADAMRSPDFGPDRRLRHIVFRVNIDTGAGRPGQVTAKITPPARASFNRHRFEERILTLLHRNGLLRDRYADCAAIAAE
jgi:hypothetical protein